MYRILFKKIVIHNKYSTKKFILQYVLSPRFQNVARVAGGRKNRGKTGEGALGGRPEFPALEVLGFQSRDRRVRNLSYFFSLEHTHRDTGQGAGHTHRDDKCPRARSQARAGPGMRGLRRLFPAFPFTACGGRPGEAERGSKDPPRWERAPGMEPRGQRRGVPNTREQWEQPGCLCPWQECVSPRSRGGSVARSGKKWEMTHQDYPFLWWGTVYIRASSPKPTIPTQPPS